MNLRELAATLGWDVQSPGAEPEGHVLGGYCGDLLSHALANAKPGEIWITIQHHANIVAIAQVTGIAGVVLAGGARAADAVVERAKEAGVALYASPDSAFVLCGKIHRALAAERR